MSLLLSLFSIFPSFLVRYVAGVLNSLKNVYILFLPVINKVAVFRLISKGTIEEMCYMRQIYKLQITSAAMGDQARGGRRQFTAVQVRNEILS